MTTCHAKCLTNDDAPVQLFSGKKFLRGSQTPQVSLFVQFREFQREMLWKCLVTLTLTFNGIAAHLNTADLSVDCHENLVEMGDQNGRCPWCGAEFEGNCDLVVVEPCGHQSCTGCHFVNNLNRELAKYGFCDAIAGSFTRTHDSTRKAKRGTFTRLYSHGFVLPDTTATVSFTRYGLLKLLHHDFS